MKLKFFCIFYFIIYSFVFANNLQKPDYIFDDKRILEEAIEAFDNLEYGDALNYALKAKEARKNKILWEIYTLENSLKPAEVKYVGDDISTIITVLKDREDYDAIEIFNRYHKIKGTDFFENSAKKLLAYIKTQKDFPEADYLIGNIYKLEGEYNFAKKYYSSALKTADILDIPSEKYNILYSLADLSLMDNDTKEYEKYLLLIIAHDSFYKDENMMSAMERTLKGTSSDTLERFFKLYRADNFNLLNAYISLSEYYQSKNHKQKSLHTSALGALTGFTKILSVVSNRNPEFKYTNLGALFEEASLYPDIIEWGINNSVWMGFYQFAEQAQKNDYPIFAKQMYNVLKDYSPEEYWRDAANTRLQELNIN